MRALHLEIAWVVATSLLATGLMPIVLVIVERNLGTYTVFLEWSGWAGGACVAAAIGYGRWLRQRNPAFQSVTLGVCLGMVLLPLVLWVALWTEFSNDGVSDPFSNLFGLFAIVAFLGPVGWLVMGLAISVAPFADRNRGIPHRSGPTVPPKA